MVFPIVIGRDDEGYFADCPALQDCHTQGDTYEEVFANIRDAMELHIQDRRERGEIIAFPRWLKHQSLPIVG